ncbi:lysophospholipid acyltransferase family protein [Aeoliella sp. SH292]|uniref:lysophospholipid acyltransferase family protein n=1 Tax=Aeoliella sp. SH292 TaxID=3454464 RepID=UPI003F95253A
MPRKFDHRDLIANPHKHLDTTQRRWLAPLGVVERVGRSMAYWVAVAIMRLGFGSRAVGLDNLPSGTFVLCPNHTSSLDAAAILSVIDQRLAYRIRWAGRRGAVLRSPFRRFANRLAGTVPLSRDLSALAVGSAILKQENVLGWFPEGTRTTTGELQDFKPGIGMLMHQLDVPAVPVFIAGAFEAWPPSSSLPRKLSQVEVRFGEPLVPSNFVESHWDDEQAIRELTEELRRRVAQLENSNSTSATETVKSN